MAGITLAWLIGETIIIWRSVSRHHRPPMPGELLGSSGFFALCAIIAEYPPARGAATALAFGIDIAAYLEAPFVTVQSGSGGANAGLAGLQKIARQQGGGSAGTTQATGTTTAGGRG